jgi:hypothetical protein
MKKFFNFALSAYGILVIGLAIIVNIIAIELPGKNATCSKR